MAKPHRDGQLRIFVSHPWTEKQLADRLARDLEPFADVWMDYRSLRPGDVIQATIDEALAEVDLMLVLWTDNASRSAGIKAEIDTARRLGLRVIPCIVEYDAAGHPSPALPDSLNGVLGVDFHHYGSGLAQVADLVVELHSVRLPEEARLEGHPGRRLIDYLRGYLSYLANYRSLRGVADERSVWVDRIIREIERFIAAGGDPASVRALVAAARRSGADDPEGLGELIVRLDAALAAGESPPASRTPAAGGGRAPSPDAAQQRVGADELGRRLSAIVPPDQVPSALADVDRYIGHAAGALVALQGYALAAQSPAGIQVVAYLQQYLGEEHDLIPDGQGRYGRVDDAWLILNTAFRLIEGGLVPVAAVPVDWPAVIAADHLVRAVMPQPVLETLAALVLQMLRTIQAEVAAYRPWLAQQETFQGTPYSPFIAAPASAGGSWEDQMNQALLGTGLSVDG